MLQIRELLWGLLLIGCAGKKRSLSPVVFICGGSSCVTRRPIVPLLQQHPLAGGIPAPDSGRSRPSRSFIPVQTNFSGAVYAPDTRLRASPVQVFPTVASGLCSRAPAARITVTLDFCVISLKFFTHAACRRVQVEVAQRQTDPQPRFIAVTQLI